jgi:hypothetical protein
LPPYFPPAQLDKWRASAQRHEAAYAQAAARLHEAEARLLGLGAEGEARAERLAGEVDVLQKRCRELGAAGEAARRDRDELKVHLMGKREGKGCCRHQIVNDF